MFYKNLNIKRVDFLLINLYMINLFYMKRLGSYKP